MATVGAGGLPAARAAGSPCASAVARATSGASAGTGADAARPVSGPVSGPVATVPSTGSVGRSAGPAAGTAAATASTGGVSKLSCGAEPVGPAPFGWADPFAWADPFCRGPSWPGTWPAKNSCQAGSTLSGSSVNRSYISSTSHPFAPKPSPGSDSGRELRVRCSATAVSPQSVISGVGWVPTLDG